jgi:hypothetical protein
MINPFGFIEALVALLETFAPNRAPTAEKGKWRWTDVAITATVVAFGIAVVCLIFWAHLSSD